jgi:hypothetical protein
VVDRVIRHPRRPGAPRALRTALVALQTAIAILVPAVGVAGADTFEDIYTDFRKTAEIPACKYTVGELRDAKDKLGSDSEQYLPGFPDALDAAIAADGDCKDDTKRSGSSGGAAATPSKPTTTVTTGQAPATTSTTPASTATTTATVAPAPTTPAPAAVAQPAPAAQDGVIAARAETPTDDGPEGWTWAVLAAAIVAAAALGWAFMNATGRVAWLTPLGHSMGEAGWRIGLRWAEFRDWMRFGTGR